MLGGLGEEAVSLVIWRAGFFVAMSCKDVVAELLINIIALPAIRQLAAWTILFVGTLLLGSIANYLLGKLVSSTGLSGTDRTLGLVFGGFRGLLIVLALVIIVPKTLPVDEDLWWTSSRLIPFFQSFEEVGRDAANSFSNLITGWI